MEQLLHETREKMQKAIEHLIEELLGVRSGRAAPSLVEGIKLSTYGQMMAIKELASVSAPEPRLLIIQPWDPNNADLIAKAIRDSGLSFNPQVENNLIRVAVPQLNEERRNDLIKIVAEKSEAAKVSIRSSRRDAMDQIEKEEKNGEISKDDAKRHSESIQKLTDDMTTEVEKIFRSKEAELKEI